MAQDAKRPEEQLKQSARVVLGNPSVGQEELDQSVIEGRVA